MDPWSRRRGATLKASGLLITRHFPIRKRNQVKIVWRVTGTGSVALEVRGPGGEPAEVLSGPDSHGRGASNFIAPGDEWGSGYSFDRAGCWRIRIARGSDSAVVTLAVEKAS